MDTMAQKLNSINEVKRRFKLGGGHAQIEKQHKRGKLTARERMEKLLDPGSFQELDLLLTSAENVFNPRSTEQPADAVVVGYGQINKRPVFLWAQDATVLGGSMGVTHAKKIAIAITEALRARVPIIGIIDSVGERVEDLIQYPHFYSLEAICKLQVLASGVIPQIILVMGPCTGGMALSAQLADFVFLVSDTSYMHVAPSPEGMDGAVLGEAWMHAQKTGCYDVFAENEEDCLNTCRELLSYLPSNNKVPPPFIDAGDDPERREEELINIVPTDLSKTYNMYQLISLIVDNKEFFELKRYWADNLIVGFARMGGRVIGLLANNPQSKGGCMTLDAADKMAGFVRFCDAFGIPLVWLADCPAFLPAVDEETRGLIRHGAKMIFANAMATVPQIVVVIRKLYGGGGLAMPSLRLGGDLSIAWPTVARGLMGAEGAVSILYRKELGAIEDKDKRKKQEQKRIQQIRGRLDLLQRESNQDIIDPRDTRPVIIKALNHLANRREEVPARKHDNMRL